MLPSIAVQRERYTQSAFVGKRLRLALEALGMMSWSESSEIWPSSSEERSHSANLELETPAPQDQERYDLKP